MSIADLQFYKALREAVVDSLKGGIAPLMSRISKDVATKLPSQKGLPTLSLKHQLWREQWDLKGMNTLLKQAKFDIDILYESLIELGASNIRRLNAIETSSRSQHASLDRIDSEVHNRLFIMQDGDGHFAGLYDDFSDMSKIDLNSSTRDIIDLRTHSVELPKNIASTSKLDLSHLTSYRVWPIKPNTTGKIISSSNAADAWFGNMFSDTLSMWRYDLVVDSPSANSIEFIFPVARVANSELSISRIEIGTMSEFSQSLEVFHSNDGVNYISFEGIGGLTELEKSSKIVALDFPSTRTQFIKFILYRDSYDKTIDRGYLTSFGLAGIGLYSMGRGQSAELISKLLDIPETRTRVEKISLSVLEQIPAQTNIEYFICPILEDETDDYKKRQTGKWLPITPVNRTKSPDEPPRVLSFSTDSVKRDIYIPSTPISSIDAYETKGTKFFQLNSEVQDRYAEKLVTEDVVWGTSFLSRGNRCWLRNKNSKPNLFRQSNCYVSFSSGNQQKAYVTTTEVVGVSGSEKIADSNRTSIKLSRLVDVRQGVALFPTENIDYASDKTPNYSISQIVLDNADEIQSESLTLTAQKPSLFSKSPIDVTKTDQVETFLIAWKAGKSGGGSSDTLLIAEIENRPSLSQYHGQTIVSISTIQETVDKDPNTPTISKVCKGTAYTAGNYEEFDAEVVEVVRSMPTRTKKTLTTLTDDELLLQFGQIKLKTSLITGMTAVNALVPTTIYKAGKDFTVEVRQVDGVKKLVAIRTYASTIPSGTQVLFSFKYAKDLTRMIHSISGDTLYLDRDFAFPTAYKARVTYRFVPTGVNEALKGSMLVTSEFDGQGITYEDGKDYYFDAKTGSIIRIQGGRIQSIDGKTACYASFNYKGPSNGLETFSTWVFVNSKDPVKFEFSKLGLDYDAGERFYVSSGTSSVDLSASTVSPDLSHGWHEIVVNSKAPDLDSGAAIYKVIKLKDTAGRPVFLGGGRYFSQIMGSRNPLVRVPIDYLRYNVAPSDHSKFAIDDDGKVVVNFQPNTQEEFFTYGYRTIIDNSNPVEVADQYNEEFEISYRYRRDGSRRVRGIFMRAVLTRSGDSPGTVTPKLFGLQARIG